MTIEQAELQQGSGFRLSVVTENGEVGHAYLYLIRNDLHDEPYGLLEDVFVGEEFRGHGYGSALVQRVIDEAKTVGCYKLIGQSRYGREAVHTLYESLGFIDHGKNFRIDF